MTSDKYIIQFNGQRKDTIVVRTGGITACDQEDNRYIITRDAQHSGRYLVSRGRRTYNNCKVNRVSDERF